MMALLFGVALDVDDVAFFDFDAALVGLAFFGPAALLLFAFVVAFDLVIMAGTYPY